MKILVTGGDERQIYLAEALEKAGFEVTFVNYLEIYISSLDFF